MSETKIVLSFDDGRADNIRAAKEILIPKGLHATFNITTAYVDGSCPAEKSPCENPAMTIDEVKWLGTAETGLFEIAAHGDRHQNDKDDIRNGVEKLKEWLGAESFKDGIGFASPNSNQRYEEVETRINEFVESGINYVRIGPHDPDNFVKRMERKMGRETLLSGIFLQGYKDTVFSPAGADARVPVKIYESIPIMKKTSIDQLKALITECEKEEKSAVLMFHSIVKKDEPYYNSDWSFDYEVFDAFCGYLREEQEAGKIEVAKNIDLSGVKRS